LDIGRSTVARSAQLLVALNVKYCPFLWSVTYDRRIFIKWKFNIIVNTIASNPSKQGTQQ